MKFTIKHTLTGLLFISFIVTGCGGPPQNNPLLSEAQTDYNRAEADPIIVSKAPVALKEAEEALEQSEKIWRDKGDKELIEHYAYIAQQKTKIAEQTARLNAAQDEVGRAEAERNQVLIEARRAEATASEKRAQEALGQAKTERAGAEKARAGAEQAREETEQAREETEKAREEALVLAARLSEMQARESERGMVLTLGDVLFGFDSANMKSGASKLINELASFLQEYPKRTVQIEGFTDSIGSAEYNQDLSRRRADALRSALVNAGISSQRINTIGYGKEFPVASNMNEAGRQQNRRVEVIISNEDGVITKRTK